MLHSVLLVVLLLLTALVPYSLSFGISRFIVRPLSYDCCAARNAVGGYKMSEWGDFSSMDDDDDVDDAAAAVIKEYAKEEDTQERKAQVGGLLQAPTVENDADPMFVPLGSQLELSEENVLGVLAACREEIGTMFGYTAENRGVGITGGVDFVDFDGPTIVLRLKGRFWHERTTVLNRVAAYLVGRIPEVIDVTVEDEWQLTQEANDAAL